MQTSSSFQDGEVMLGFSPNLSQFHGASPTTYYCGQVIMRSLMQTKGFEPMKKETTFQPPNTIYETKVVETSQTPYSNYHELAFMDFSESSQMCESATIDELNATDHKGNTPLIWAALEGRGDVVRLLVDSGADVDVQNFEGASPLYLAAERGDNEMVMYLIENGANVNIQSEEGVTPAHIAAVNGNLNVLRTLAAHGAHLEATDNAEETTIHYAVRGGHSDVVQYLVNECHVELNVQNEDMETPLQLASCFEETSIVEFLTAAVSKQMKHGGAWNEKYSLQDNFGFAARSPVTFGRLMV